MSDIYIVGMSNTKAVIAALPLYKGALSVEVDNLNSQIDGPWYLPGRKLNPAYFQEKVHSKLVVAMMFGNWYNSLALIQHPSPFDFAIPNFDTTVDDNVTLVPFSQMWRKFRNCMRHQMNPLFSLRKLTPGRLIFIEPPPPIASEEHIKRFPGPFKEVLSSGITSKMTRLKLWKLQSMAIAELCDELGIDFIAFPEEACTPDGFLREGFYSNDPVHANAQGGLAILRKLEVEFHG